MNDVEDMRDATDALTWPACSRSMFSYMTMSYEEPVYTSVDSPTGTAGLANDVILEDPSIQPPMDTGMVAAYRLAGVI